MNATRAWAAVLLLGIAISTGTAVAQSGGGYDLTWNTIDGGGATFSTGGPYSLGSTMGQPDAGSHAASAFALSGGFWFLAASPFSVSIDFDDDSATGATIYLVCTSGMVDPPSATAMEGSPAMFTVSGYTGSPTCTATQDVPVGYTADQLDCTDVLLTTGTCSMFNFVIPGNIFVELVTGPSPDTTFTMFDFTAGGGLVPTSFSLGDGDVQAFTGVAPGSGYSIVPTVPNGWELTSATCSDGSSPDSIEIDPNETVTCSFMMAYTEVIPAVDNLGFLVLMSVLAFVGTVVLSRRSGV